ncbi:MAG: hypothetical protein M1832_002091 [Thelocarpon impressellum]|nr:MAG: hypothetical protein M1832_002091 [Thelocarpon impressellum]
MDFWHCHKPAVPNDSENCHTAGASKGYAAANKLSAEPGVGFINLSYFLLAEKDCSGLTVGTVDEQAGGWRLMKWSLSVIPEDGAAQQMFPEDAFVAAQLLALVDSQAVKKFIIHCDDDAQGLFMWVFNADLRYCSSLRGPTPRRAMKVFYGYHNAMDLRAKQTLSIEELQVPLDVLETVRDSLTRSTSLLPPSARAFQQWRVGLLERFDLASRTKANG